MKVHFKTERLRLEIHIVPPDRRKRDISNLIKATEDSCPWFTDDSQIDELKVVRHPPDEAKEGYVVIKLETLKDDSIHDLRLQRSEWETALQRPEGAGQGLPAVQDGSGTEDQQLGRGPTGPVPTRKHRKGAGPKGVVC